MSQPQPHNNINRSWHMTACFASSLDGIIHPDGAPETFQKLTSSVDMNHLKTLRDQHDVILMGAETFRHYPKPHTGHTTEPPLIIITRGTSPLTDVPPDSPAFHTDNNTAITIISTRQPELIIRQQYPANIHWDLLPINKEEATHWNTWAQSDLFKKHHRILFEGGGQLFGMLLKAQWIDELYLTYSPILLGGSQQSARPLLGHYGFTLENAPRCLLQPKTTHIIDNTGEIIAHYHLTYPPPYSI